MPYRNGKDGWEVYPGVGCVLLLPPFAGSAFVVCAREQEGRLKSLVHIILRARPVRWVSLRLSTAYSATLICYPNTDSY